MWKTPVLKNTFSSYYYYYYYFVYMHKYKYICYVICMREVNIMFLKDIRCDNFVIIINRIKKISYFKFITKIFIIHRYNFIYSFVYISIL